MEDNGHELWTPEDFKKMTPEERIKHADVIDMVLESGFFICKKCGDGEAGLDDPCVPRKGFDITIKCNNCGSENVSVTLNGPYQVVEATCRNCPNEGEESV